MPRRGAARRAVRPAYLAAAVAIALAIGGGLSFPEVVEETSPRLPETPPAPQLRANELAPALVTVVPGVHLLGLTFPNASYVVETEAGLALVDTCAEEDARPVIEQVEALGLDVRRIKLILLTHCHADHALGAQRLRAISGAKVCAGRGDCAVLRSGTDRDAIYSVFTMPQRPHPTDVDVELAGGEELDLGGSRFHAIATPGHTPGSMCYLLERDGLRILFTGDTVMSLTDVGALTGAGIYSAYLPPRYRGDARAFAASLRRLKAMPVPDLVLPGHPAADETPQDPRLSQPRWEALLQHAIAKLDVLAARYEMDGAGFLDGKPKELLPGLRYWGDLDGRAVYALVDKAGRLFVFNAPGGAALADFVRRRCAESGLAGVAPTAVLLTASGPEASSGLASLVGATRCAVVAPAAAIEALRARCPAGTNFVDARSLASSGWFPADVVEVRGVKTPSIAYVIRWADRTVVVSGKLPARTELDSGLEIAPSLPAHGLSMPQYARTLDEFADVTPDLWLPAVPVCGQNAYVYDSDWIRTVCSNRRLRQ